MPGYLYQTTNGKGWHENHVLYFVSKHSVIVAIVEPLVDWNPWNTFNYYYTYNYYLH